MTVIRFRPLGERLLELLHAAHDDDGAPPLRVLHDPPALAVLREDGSELSETEDLEVRALLAADAAERF